MIIAVMLIGCLCACASGGDGNTEENDRIQIVTTIFPEYDWVTNVLGSNPAEAEVTLLLDNGVDMHSYQPAAEDMLKISSCDLFIYVGGESDEWAEDVLKEAVNKDMEVINLLEVLGNSVKEEELVEGMQEDTESQSSGGEDAASKEDGYDEHVWLSLRNASVFTEAISESMQVIDPAHADMYRDNAAAYTGKLDALDTEYQNYADSAGLHTLLFGDRFPFRYLFDDYGLDYYAAFAGCSAETEASFETITFLSKKVDELSLPAVMVMEGTDHRIAETIVENTQSKDQQILTMDSMQSTTAEDVEDGASYLSIMEDNLSVLREALK